MEQSVRHHKQKPRKRGFRRGAVLGAGGLGGTEPRVRCSMRRLDFSSGMHIADRPEVLPHEVDFPPRSVTIHPWVSTAAKWKMSAGRHAD